jgi:hypothetical protein
MDRFTWDDDERHFIDQDGNYVPRRSVRDALDHVIDATGDDIEEACRKLRKLAEEEDDDDHILFWWFGTMQGLIKTSHVMAGIIAAGGLEQLTSADRNLIADRVRTQFGYLREFAGEINNGLPLDEEFVRRSRMYGTSGTATYEAINRRGMGLIGYTEERRLLHSAKPCGPCIDYAGQGWVPIGTLPEIGQDCDCKSNCRCSFEYRMRSIL